MRSKYIRSLAIPVILIGFQALISGNGPLKGASPIEYDTTLDSLKRAQKDSAFLYNKNACDNKEVYIPNFFTPNGDGVNDVLFVYTKLFQRMKFIIYDRWGTRVFESNHTSEGWDGTFRGAILDPAGFVYVLEYKCNHKLIRTSGNISILD